jgi:two-component system NtrC family sensor kinase
MLTVFSRGGEAFLGYGRDELPGRYAEAIAEDPGNFLQLLEECRTRGQVVGRDVVLRRRDGSSLPTELTLIELRDPGGQACGFAGFFVEKADEEAFQEKLIRIDRLAEIGRTAADVAHDINNPLSNINQISGWMGTVVADAEGLTEDERGELETAVVRIGEQIERCRRLAHQLLSFAKGSAPMRDRCDLRKVLGRAVAFLAPELKHKRVDVALDFRDEEELTVYSDSRLLEQVFVNIVANAVYAAKEVETGGRVSLKTAKTDSYLVVAVIDNGPGIPEEIKDKIFDIFFTTKPPGKGTGLGIPISYNILKKLGGDMTVESEPGAGTTVTVRLPAT